MIDDDKVPHLRSKESLMALTTGSTIAPSTATAPWGRS